MISGVFSSNFIFCYLTILSIDSLSEKNNVENASKCRQDCFVIIIDIRKKKNNGNNAGTRPAINIFLVSDIVHKGPA